jgi:hypothetical protein
LTAERWWLTWKQICLADDRLLFCAQNSPSRCLKQLANRTNDFHVLTSRDSFERESNTLPEQLLTTSSVHRINTFSYRSECENDQVAILTELSA